MSNITHSFGETTEAEIRERLPHKFEMHLNQGDMVNLLRILATDDQEWGAEFRMGILASIGIEEI